MVKIKIPRSTGNGGRHFDIGSHQMFINQMEAADLWTSVREAVHNALRSGASEVEIFSVNGKIGILDNGTGMSRDQMIQNLGTYGGGDNKRGPMDHMGIGIKVASMQHPDGIFVVSKTVRSNAHGVILGRTAEDRFGLRANAENGQIIWPSELPKFSSGTLAVLTGLDFEPFRLMSYLNNRFLTFPNEVTVKVLADAVRKPVGLIAAITELCEASGVVRGPDATIYWGILPDVSEGGEKNAAEENYRKHYITPSCFYDAWGGEAYAWHRPMHSSRRLQEFGIRAGARRLMFVVEAKGRKIRADISRNSINGWGDGEEHAKQFFIEHLPPELEAFMDDFEARHFAPELESPWVKEFVTAIGLLGARLPNATKEEGEQGADTPPQPTRRRKSAPESSEEPQSPPRPPMGLPTPVFVDRHEGGSEIAIYNGVSNRLMVNKDASPIKGLLEGRSGTKLAIVRRLILAEVTMNFVSFKRLNGALPNQAELSAMASFFSLVTLYEKKMLKGIKL